MPSTQWPTLTQMQVEWLAPGNPTTPTFPTNIQKAVGCHSNVGVSFGTYASTQLDSTMVSSKAHFRQVEMRANHQSMDKVMKRLGIEVVELRGKDVKSIVHCNSKGKLVGGGRNS